jgi:hypothetical protein
MKTRLLPLLLATLAVAPSGRADTAMQVQTWDVGCEHTLNTNFFDLAPGDSVEIQLDFSSCPEDKLGGMLVYGYRLARNSAPQLGARDNLRFTVVDLATKAESWSDSGYLMTQLTTPTRCVVYVQNMNRSKSLTVRLRAKSGL